MDRTEFDKKVEIFRRMVATLDSAADLVSSVWEEDHDGSADAIRDLSKRVKSALDSVGIDVDEWLAEEALELELAPTDGEAKRIEAREAREQEGPWDEVIAELREGLSALILETARDGGPQLGEVQKAQRLLKRTGGPGRSTSLEKIRDRGLAEAAANRGDRAGGQEDQR